MADSPTEVLNYFDCAEAAQRYARGRPRGQSVALAMMESVLHESLPVASALDVGCGTGHSSMALLPYAWQIVGLEPSSAMLAEAERHPRIEYLRGYAECMPFRNGEFDLVTASSAYCWFDHSRFLADAVRVLRPEGWLVVYKAASMGRIPGTPEFESWRRTVFADRFSKVVRNDEPLSAERAQSFGLREIAREVRIFTRRFELEAYIENLLTHSSVIRVVYDGSATLAEIRAWFRTELAPFFPPAGAIFAHEARCQVLRRV